MLEALERVLLFINLEKYAFYTTSVSFLGFIITPNGVVIDPKRVETIIKWPKPTSYRKILVFLEFANFYRRFISYYS